MDCIPFSTEVRKVLEWSFLTNMVLENTKEWGWFQKFSRRYTKKANRFYWTRACSLFHHWLFIPETSAFIGDCRFGNVSIAHNGNLANTNSLWKNRSPGAVLQSTMDTEMILHLIAQSSFDGFEDAVKEALWEIEELFLGNNE